MRLVAGLLAAPPFGPAAPRVLLGTQTIQIATEIAPGVAVGPRPRIGDLPPGAGGAGRPCQIATDTPKSAPDNPAPPFEALLEAGRVAPVALGAPARQQHANRIIAAGQTGHGHSIFCLALPRANSCRPRQAPGPRLLRAELGSALDSTDEAVIV
eukprot:8107597-Pyramimonas_sp.AAC.1